MCTNGIKRAVTILALSATLGAAPAFGAEKPGTPSESDYQVIKISKKCGFRSLHSFHASANLACWEAERLRRQDPSVAVEIVKGVGARPLPPSYRCHHEVYRNACKSFGLHGSYPSLHDAMQAAINVAKSGDRIEIVACYGR